MNISQLLRTRIACVLAALAMTMGMLPATSYSQGVSSAGKEFWIGFMPNYIVPATTINLFLASGTDNRVKIDFFGEGGKIASTKVVNLLADKAMTVNMPVGLSETRQREEAQYKAIRVTAIAPVAVYGMSNGSATTDGYLALPIEAYGTEYYCISYYDDAYSPGFDHLGGEFMIIAPHDGTTVEITTTATTTRDDAGNPSRRPGEKWTVGLNKGQTYLVQTTGWNWGEEDLTGSYIKSDKPIAFLTGHQRAGIEMGEANNSKDHLIEMIPSIDKWGTEYFEMPMIGRTRAGDYIRVLSAEDGNQLTRNGSTFQLNAGEYYDVSQSLAPTVFRSLNNKKFLVMSYNYTQGAFGDPGVGDPDMITMTPKEQFQNKLIFRTPTNQGGSAYTHYSTWISTKPGLEAIRIRVDGRAGAGQSLTSLGAAGTFNFPGTDFWATRLRLAAGEISYVAEGPVPFGCYLYGYTGVESYGWPAGMALKILSPDPMAPLEAERTEDCGDYNVKITETHLMPKDAWDDTKISSIDLIELNGDTRWTRLSENYTLEVDPAFQMGDTVTTYKLFVKNKMLDAYAAVYMLDRAGNDTVYEYTYIAPKLTTTPEPTFVFDPVLVATDSCRTITLTNSQASGNIKLNTASILGIAKFGKFEVTPADLNVTLAPGESTEIQVCFNPEDSGRVVDSLIVETECAPFRFALEGRGVTPIIYANDLDFKCISPGEEKCADVEVTNRGTYKLVINAQDLATNNPDFRINPSQTFPITIDPGQKKNVNFCFNPDVVGTGYTVTVNFATNIPTKFEGKDKDFSILVGCAQAPGAKLTVLDKPFGATNCEVQPIYTDTLYNDGTESNEVDSVRIEGPGAASYSIIAATRQTPYVLGSNQAKEQGERYTIQFNPNAAGNTTAPQLAELVAYTSAGIKPITKLSGSRIAPILTNNTPGGVDLGLVKINTAAAPGTAEVQNTGSDTLFVTNVTLTGADPGNFTVEPTTFMLLPGKTRTLTVNGTAGAQSRTYTAVINVIPEGCTQPITVNTTLAASAADYLAQGENYQTVFQCKDREGTGELLNSSSNDDIVLQNVEIVNIGTWQNAGDFAPGTTFVPGEIVEKDNRYVFPVTFTPTAGGLRQAGLRFTFVLDGDQKDTTVLLEGIGALYPQVLGVGSTTAATPAVYTAAGTESMLTIPVLSTEKFENGGAALKQYRFDISFKRDAFGWGGNANPVPDIDGPANVGLDVVSLGVDQTTGYQTFRVTTNGDYPDFSLADHVAQLELMPRVFLENTTEIRISNAMWMDINGDSACYVPTDYVPATYTYTPLCGDEALKDYLADKSIKEIAFGSVAPNPVKTESSINFEINGPARKVTMGVYNALGKEVVRLIDNVEMAAGQHTAKFNASELSEGTYFVRLTNGSAIESRQITIAK